MTSAARVEGLDARDPNGNRYAAYRAIVIQSQHAPEFAEDAVGRVIQAGLHRADPKRTLRERRS